MPGSGAAAGPHGLRGAGILRVGFGGLSSAGNSGRFPSVGRRYSEARRRPDDPTPPTPIDVTSSPFDGTSTFPARVPGNFVALVRAPIAWKGRSWRSFGLGLVAVGAVMVFDQQIDSWTDEYRTPSSIEAAEVVRPLGTEGALAVLGATWLAGRQMGWPRLAAISEDSLEAALFAAGVITPLVKTVTGRDRPRHSDSSGDFFGSGHSFPSGETTLAFSIASVVAAHSDRWWVDAIAWGSAGLIGLERMVLDAHWASDVVAGALIGAAVGSWVVRRNQPDLEGGPRFSISPQMTDDAFGVSVGVRF